MKTHLIAYTTMIALTAACAPDDGVDGDDTGVPQDEASATLRGRSASRANLAAEDGVKVATAYKVTADGSLESISAGSAELDASGAFELSVAPQDADTPVIVRVEDGSETHAVIVGGTIEEDGTVDLAPVDAETTAESDLLVELATDGAWDASTMTTVDLRDRVSVGMGLALEAAENHEVSVDAAAEATLSATLAARETATSTSVGMSGASVSSVQAEGLEAMAALDASLYAATSEMARTEARAAFDSRIDGAWRDAGFTVADVAIMAHGEAEAAETTGAEADVLASVMARAEAERARRVTAALMVEAEASGMSESAQNDLDARGELLVSALAEQSERANPEPSDVDGAWTEYRTDVEAWLEGETSIGLDAVLNTLIGDLDVTAQLVSDAEVDAEAASDAQARAEIVAEAVSDFWTDVSTDASSEALVTAGLTEAEAEAMVALQGHLALSSR